MKRLSALCAMFALPAIPYGIGLHGAESAHAAQNQTVSDQVTITPEDVPLTDADMPDLRQVECVAKVIVHEAGNQIRRGQIAVAQVIRTRMQRRGADACGVVNERGQFFNVDAFQPARGTALWRDAVAIATETLNGEGEEVVPGAMFFGPARHPLRGRIRVARIDDHIFYR